MREITDTLLSDKNIFVSTNGKSLDVLTFTGDEEYTWRELVVGDSGENRDSFGSIAHAVEDRVCAGLKVFEFQDQADFVANLHKIWRDKPVAKRRGRPPKVRK